MSHKETVSFEGLFRIRQRAQIRVAAMTARPGEDPGKRKCAQPSQTSRRIPKFMGPQLQLARLYQAPRPDGGAESGRVVRRPRICCSDDGTAEVLTVVRRQAIAVHLRAEGGRDGPAASVHNDHKSPCGA
ncbi:hypothetical protein GCM10010495_44900 [Kitasatospora herbaricolor]|nr:hypothetical protein GCM10010495_44900 [Kitasatospora herbaricolor]